MNYACGACKRSVELLRSTQNKRLVLYTYVCAGCGHSGVVTEQDYERHQAREKLSAGEGSSGNGG